MKALLPLLFIWTCIGVQAQQVLHYSETSGFDHNTRTVSLALFQALGSEYGFTVVDDQDGTEFNSLSNLQQFDVVVFSNTSGNAILDPTQQANFEAYINSGGSYLGIHAASDTYRHSTANGNNTGTWDFYAELIGASVQESPNHVSGTPSYSMEHIGTHVSTAALPDPWTKNEEYYYWESGYFGSNNTAVLQVEQTIGPNGMVNSYDAPRPMSWFRNLSGGSRMFYTALGHAQNNFTSDSLFIAHIRDALLWTMDNTTSIQQSFTDDAPELIALPAGFQVKLPSTWRLPAQVQWVTIDGKTIRVGSVNSSDQIIYPPKVSAQQLILRISEQSGKTAVLAVPFRYD